MQSIDRKSQGHQSISKGIDWISIVDDEYDIMNTIKQGLEYNGFSVFGFTEPVLALERFQIHHKRLVL